MTVGHLIASLKTLIMGQSCGENGIGENPNLAPPPRSSTESKQDPKELEHVTDQENMELSAKVSHLRDRVYWDRISLRCLIHQGLPDMDEESSLERLYKLVSNRNISAESFLKTANTNPAILIELYKGMKEPRFAKKVVKIRAMSRLIGAMCRFDRIVNIQPVHEFGQKKDASAESPTPMPEVNTDHSAQSQIAIIHSLNEQLEILNMQVDDFKDKRGMELKHQERMVKNIKDLKPRIKEAKKRWLSLKPLIKSSEEKLNIPSLFADRELVNRSFGSATLSAGAEESKVKSAECAGGSVSQEANPDSFYNQYKLCERRIDEITKDRRFSEKQHHKAITELHRAWNEAKEIIFEPEELLAQGTADE